MLLIYNVLVDIFQISYFMIYFYAPISNTVSGVL